MWDDYNLRRNPAFSRTLHMLPFFLSPNTTSSYAIIKRLLKKFSNILKYVVQNAITQESMEKLDVKDRKILYELDIDSRQSFSQLGKKVGLHKDVVAYRVKKLQEKGIIKNFYTEINNNKIGFSAVRLYLTYQNITPEIKKEIIDYLVKIRILMLFTQLKDNMI
jgi:predicted transcriptional regulator